MTESGDNGGACPAPKRPAEALAERMLAARNTLGKACDLIEEVLASVHGRPKPQPERPMVAPAPGNYRRFFPAMESLVGDIEAESARLKVLAEGLDEAF